MITKCPYCDYSKPDNPLSKAILEVLTDDLPIEDYMLWIERLVNVHGFKEYNGVKIHMGRMHKDLFMSGDNPSHILNDEEKELLKRVSR